MIINKEDRGKLLEVMDHRLEQWFHEGIFISKIIFFYANYDSIKYLEKQTNETSLPIVRESIINLNVIMSGQYLST